jgi:hypothetical protein
MKRAATTARRGSPLVVLAALVIVWIGGRATLWENPFTFLPADLPNLIAQADRLPASPEPPAESQQTATQNILPAKPAHPDTFDRFIALTRPPYDTTSFDSRYEPVPFAMAPRAAAGHQMLLSAALSYVPSAQAFDPVTAIMSGRVSGGFAPANPPPFAVPLPVNAAAPRTLDRWSLEGWAFWRQGSSASAISQGRVPIYGASQLGAILQYRLATNSRRDPRAYARTYRALVSNGESEIAGGVSLRPLGNVPLRAQAELRLTDTPFATQLRPAAFVVTEFAPQPLPGGLVAEAYGQAGWVGGENATAFADGQIVVTRKVAQFDLAAGKPARLSLGAGAWGGAQRDAARVDLGPSLRLDLEIGQVPARLSLDWREQVAGDAAPSSGLAATLSTRF